MTRQCDNCGQHYDHELSGLTKVVWNGKEQKTHYFCRRDCMHDHYIAHLRQWEGYDHVHQ